MPSGVAEVGHAAWSESRPCKQAPKKAFKRATKTAKKQKRRAYGTPDSHVVPHRSTDRACSGLTAQFGRDTVRFTEYGRRRVQQQYRRYMKQLLPELPFQS